MTTSDGRASPPETAGVPARITVTDAGWLQLRVFGVVVKGHYGQTNELEELAAAINNAALAASPPETAGVLVPPPHPESQVMKWSALELAAIKAYGERCWCAGRSTGPAAPETAGVPAIVKAAIGELSCTRISNALGCTYEEAMGLCVLAGKYQGTVALASRPQSAEPQGAQTPVPQSEPVAKAGLQIRPFVVSEHLRSAEDVREFLLACLAEPFGLAEDREPFLANAIKHAINGLVAQTATPQSEAVAEVGPGWSLVFVGSESLSAICARHPDLRIGSKLYLAPPSSDGREPKEQK